MPGPRWGQPAREPALSSGNVGGPCYRGAPSRRGTTTMPSSPVPACAPITAPTSDTSSRATCGSRSRKRWASSSARSAAPRWCTARSAGPVPGGPDRELHHPLGRPRRRPHLLQRHDPPLRHVQQRLDRQRAAHQRRRRADAASPAQPVQGVDAEEHAAATRRRRAAASSTAAASAPPSGRVGGRQHREAQAHRRRPRVDHPHAPRPDLLGRRAAPPPTFPTARATGAPTPPSVAPSASAAR